MLQRVALGQVRFNLPGLTVDARGVVGGKQLVVRFAAVDRLVSFFRVLSSEQSLDDLQPGLRIAYARGAAGTREALVVLPAGSPHLGEEVARAARMAGGQCFTGSGKHFVQFRDARAPLGYDAGALSQEAGDLILYAVEQVVAYRIESELPLAKLLLRLSLQRRHGADAAPPPDRVLYLVARRGVGATVAEYLYRAQSMGARDGRGARASGGGGAGGGAATAGVAGASAAAAVSDGAETPLRASVAVCETAAESAFSGGRTFWLFKLEGVPARMRGLLTGTPGLELFEPVTDNVAVASGYRHPIHLEACRGSFPADRFYLFSPRVAGVTVVSPNPVLSAIEDVVRIPAPAPRDPPHAESAAVGRPDITVPLRLEPAADPRRRAVATLIPWSRASWLRRLCYAMPPTALRGYRVALLERGILVLSGGSLEGFPFGVLLDSAAPDVLVPLGTRVRPAIAPALLAERVGATAGTLVVFPALGEDPFRVAAGAIETLDRRAIASVEQAAPAALAGVRAAPPPVAPNVEIENDPLGPMPLWGLDR